MTSQLQGSSVVLSSSISAPTAPKSLGVSSGLWGSHLMLQEQGPQLALGPEVHGVGQQLGGHRVDAQEVPHEHHALDGQCTASMPRLRRAGPLRAAAHLEATAAPCRPKRS
ncbi:hypothetical protein EYF80_059211 [Liparis tanakae]|uniref:Uncharacterized protein n=1 Tax=Liparis tanakae TaxID=230148 RepID=A0A4Z2EP95_9TELE|nr:hypothetical protein EYF80_059211 [Liparis tanakae]